MLALQKTAAGVATQPPKVVFLHVALERGGRSDKDGFTGYVQVSPLKRRLRLQGLLPLAGDHAGKDRRIRGAM